MAIELKVPAVGESVTDVQIGDWLKKVGDQVTEEEVVVIIETDKVTVDLPAPASGVITEIKVQSGEEAQVGDVIALMEEGAVADEGADQGDAKADGAPKDDDGAAPSGGADEQVSSAAADPRASIPPQGFARVMPAAARAMAERGISADQVTPTGPGGRILKEDVLRAAEAPKPSGGGAKAPAPAAAGPRQEEVVSMSPLRRRIAERLVQSQQSAALLTTFNECDMSEVMRLRKAYQDSFVKKHGVKVGFMSFFIKAAIEALKEIPEVNAEIRGTDIVYKNYYDVGVAVGGGRGLVVPVIRNAERLSFAEIEKTIGDFSVRAKDNKITLDELTGGTFTISNGGVYGSMLSTPIVNPPQSGILGLHNILQRPVAVDGQVVIRPMMYLALTYDHRIVDGKGAVTFLKRVKEAIEAPSRILLEV